VTDGAARPFGKSKSGRCESNTLTRPPMDLVTDDAADLGCQAGRRWLGQPQFIRRLADLARLGECHSQPQMAEL
jgi:hypothetical protein